MFVPEGFVSCSLNLNCKGRRNEEWKQCPCVIALAIEVVTKVLMWKWDVSGSTKNTFFTEQAEYEYFACFTAKHKLSKIVTYMHMHLLLV